MYEKPKSNSDSKPSPNANIDVNVSITAILCLISTRGFFWDNFWYIDILPFHRLIFPSYIVKRHEDSKDHRSEPLRVTRTYSCPIDWQPRKQSRAYAFGLHRESSLRSDHPAFCVNWSHPSAHKALYSCLIPSVHFSQISASCYVRIIIGASIWILSSHSKWLINFALGHNLRWSSRSLLAMNILYCGLEAESITNTSCCFLSASPVYDDWNRPFAFRCVTRSCTYFQKQTLIFIATKWAKTLSNPSVKYIFQAGLPSTFCTQLFQQSVLWRS